MPHGGALAGRGGGCRHRPGVEAPRRGGGRPKRGGSLRFGEGPAQSSAPYPHAAGHLRPAGGSGAESICVRYPGGDRSGEKSLRRIWRRRGFVSSMGKGRRRRPGSSAKSNRASRKRQRK